jgi:hypothetical protein
MSPAWFSTAIFTPASTARPRALQHRQRVGDTGLDAAVSEPVGLVAQDDPKRRRADRLGHADAERQMFLCGSPVLLEHAGTGADAPRPEHEMNPPIGGVAADLAERIIVGGPAKRCEIGDEHRVPAEFSRVVDELPSVPLHRPHGEVVEAETDRPAPPGPRHTRRQK